MRIQLLITVLLSLAGSLVADERRFDFSAAPVNQPPPDCVSTVTGTGVPGTWKIITDEVPLAFAPLSVQAPSTSKKSVIAQLANDITDEHFPMLILGNDVYGDFTFTTQFKIVDGVSEQMAGIAFRIQDEKNYYVARISAMGTNFAFYKFEKGLRSPPIRSPCQIKKGEWHEMAVECRGVSIHITIDGQDAMPPFTDPTFAAGKIGLWTKSDSITYFADARITYKQREAFAVRMVRDVTAEFPRLLDLKIVTAQPGSAEPRVFASSDPKDVGQPGYTTDADGLKRGNIFTMKRKDSYVVILPLHDRNGDVVAVVHVAMKTFKGQTEENAIIRATPVIKAMEKRLAVVGSLTEE